MSNKDITLVYYTDNNLPDDILKYCQSNIMKSADSQPILSVSQKPIDFGHNICVGDIGRSHLSLFTQIMKGVEQVKTKYVALVEHDCLYTPEHFSFVPPDNEHFFYNVNHWFVDWNSGMYSYFRRKVLSMMIADTELTIRAARDKVTMLEMGAKIRKGQPGACEFGVCDSRVAFVDYLASMKDFGKEIGSYKACAFRTVNPNLDIRHKNNFSGNRRGRSRCYELPYWGRFKKEEAA